MFYALAIFAVDLYSRTYFRMQILVYRYQQMLLTCYGSHNILNNQFANTIFLLKKNAICSLICIISEGLTKAC